jgi:hypothetical protein
MQRLKEMICLLLLRTQKRERNAQILRRAKGGGLGCENTLGQFAALVNLCDMIVTGHDYPAPRHRLKKKVVALSTTCGS